MADVDARILVVGWSGHAVDHRVIAALGGVEGDRLAEDLERRRRLVATRSETTP